MRIFRSKTLKQSTIVTFDPEWQPGKDWELVTSDEKRNMFVDRHLLSCCKDEKNWRITAFRWKSDDRISQGYLLDKTFQGQLNQAIKGEHPYQHDLYIYSVEVKQNGEWVSYKIGEKIQFSNKVATIKSFYPILDGAYYCAAFEEKEFLGLNISCLKKLIKTSLFQLEDENGKMIDIYEGDKFYSIHSKSFNISVHNAAQPDTAFNINVKAGIYKVFATEKAAQQYIDQNKRIYSKQDILNACKELKLDYPGNSDLFSIYALKKYLKL